MNAYLHWINDIEWYIIPLLVRINVHFLVRSIVYLYYLFVLRCVKLLTLFNLFLMPDFSSSVNFDIKFFPLIYFWIICGWGITAFEDLNDTILLLMFSFKTVFLFDLTGIIFLPFTVIFIFLIISFCGLLF